MYLSNRTPNLTHHCQLATIGQGNKNPSWKYVYSHIFFPSNIHISKVESITHMRGGLAPFLSPALKTPNPSWEYHGMHLSTNVGFPRSSFCSVNWRKWNPTIQCRSVIHFFFGPFFCWESSGFDYIVDVFLGRMFFMTKHWHCGSPKHTQGFTAGLLKGSWLYYSPEI